MGSVRPAFHNSCYSLHNFVTEILYFHQIAVYFTTINLTSRLECVLDNTEVQKSYAN